MIFFLLGLSSWIVVEYLMHRFVLHGIADDSHSPHHADPKDISELFVDTKTVAIVSVIFCTITLVLFEPINVFWLYLGVSCGYFAYETVHYRVHHCKVSTSWMKYLRKHHLQHHFTKEKCNYSVVFPPLDRLFKTSRYLKQ